MLKTFRTRSWVKPHQLLIRLYSSSAFNFTTVLQPENMQRCKQLLYHGTKPRVMPWMKDRKDLRKAAILIPLCTISGVPSLLYTVRSKELKEHGGQVSFPGGFHDDSDAHLLDTALREAEEEIGLSEDAVDVWGQMIPIPGKNFGSAVIPVIASCGEVDIAALKPNPDEVESIFAISLARLCDPSLHGYTSFSSGYTLPVYWGGTRRIWGLTAIATHLCLKLVIHNDSVYKLDIPMSGRVHPR